MNNKRNKIIGIIVGLVIVAVGILGVWFIGPSLYETEEPTEVSTQEDEFLFERNLADDSSDTEPYEVAFTEIDSEYIWLDCDEDNTWTFDVYQVSKESLESKIANLPTLDRGMRISDTETVKECAEIIISNFGTEKEKIGILYYLTYEVPANISCLETEFEGVSGDRYTPSEDINDEGLVLSYENVSAGKVMTGNGSLFKDYNVFAVEVITDVTCEENSGKFKDVSWIPDKGQTSEVTFVVWFEAVDGAKNEISVYDIGVIE